MNTDKTKRRFLSAFICVHLWPKLFFAAEGLRFEAVSIHASTVDIRGRRQAAGGGPGTSDPGHVRLYGISPRSLIMLGFDLANGQLTGQTSTNPAFFDIEATLARGTTKEQYKEMVRNLLADRFGLQYHMEKREVPGYELTAEKRVKLNPADHSAEAYEHAPRNGLQRRLDAHGAPELQPGRAGRLRLALASGGTRISGRMQTATDLVAMCSSELRVPVIDKTGLTGEYDFNLDFLAEARFTRGQPETTAVTAPAAQPEATLRMPDFSEAVSEQLGLKLIKKKVPFDSLVVDRIERPKED